MVPRSDAVRAVVLRMQIQLAIGQAFAHSRAGAQRSSAQGEATHSPAHIIV
jgi:hypothetical protein